MRFTYESLVGRIKQMFFPMWVGLIQSAEDPNRRKMLTKKKLGYIAGTLIFFLGLEFTP